MNKTGNREQGRENSGAELVTAIAPAQLTLAEVRAKLEGKRGKRFWKNLDELAEAPGFHEMLEREFPRQASEWVDAVSRRGFLKVMGASLALAGLAGCTKQPDEPIFPYVKAPEDLILGKPMYFASAFPFPTGAIPVLVKSDAFRPIKVDGNPDHPMSKGKSDVFTQASLLDLYDPDRSKEVLFRGQPSEYADFQQAFTNAVKKTGDGTGIYFLSETVTSPTLAAQWKQVQAKYPAAKLVQWEPVNRDAARSASKAVDARMNFPLECKLIELLTPEDGPAVARRELRRLRKFTGTGVALLGSYLEFASRQSARLNLAKDFARELEALWADGKGPASESRS